MQFPIFISLHRSTFLIFLLVSLHGVAAFCLAVLPWSLILRGIFLALLGLSLGHALRPPKIVGLRLCGPDRLDCLLADDGDSLPVKILPGSTVFSQLIVLRLRIGEGKRVISLTVLPDQMSGQQFRLLRLWLRWQAEPNDVAGNAL